MHFFDLEVKLRIFQLLHENVSKALLWLQNLPVFVPSPCFDNLDFGLANIHGSARTLSHHGLINFHAAHDSNFLADGEGIKLL
jgi:hypothetical protein